MSEERSPWVSRALVVVLVLMGFGAGILTFAKDRRANPGGGRFHPDTSFVAITSAGKLEVRDGTDGSLIRLLREDLVVPSGATAASLTVARDGRYAFHDASQTTCRSVKMRAIAKVDLVRGLTLLDAIGSSPSLSPDGRRLAYLAPSTGGERTASVSGGRPVCGLGPAWDGKEGVLVVRELRADRERQIRLPAQPLDPPRWVRGRIRIRAGGVHWLIDPDTLNRTRTSGGPFSIVEGLRGGEALGVDCYVKKSKRSAPLPPAPDQAVGEPCEFAIVDPRTGERNRSIATLGAYGHGVRIADLDDDGRRLLAGWVFGEKKILLGYTLGAKRATVLGERVVGAAWLP